MANEHWYALKVRPGFEIVVARRLRKLGLEAFVPASQLAGSVYCRFALETRPSLTRIPGVLDILGAPYPTPCDRDILSFQAAVGSR